MPLRPRFEPRFVPVHRVTVEIARDLSYVLKTYDRVPDPDTRPPEPAVSGTEIVQPETAEAVAV